MNWKLWLYGIAAAVVGGAASAAGNVFILPLTLSDPSIKKVLFITGLNAAFAGGAAFFAYLKTHPVPEWTGGGRRADDPAVVTVPATDGKDASALPPNVLPVAPASDSAAAGKP